jgi:UDP-N-acetyl-D-mannosaminuronate dehydrogenase
MYTDDELIHYGFVPYHYGEQVDAAILQADHAQYRELAPKDLPSVKTLLDGRGVTDEAKWAGIRYHVVGRAI